MTPPYPTNLLRKIVLAHRKLTIMWNFDARLSRHYFDLIHNLSAECLFPDLITFTLIIVDERRGSNDWRPGEQPVEESGNSGAQRTPIDRGSKDGVNGGAGRLAGKRNW